MHIVKHDEVCASAVMRVCSADMIERLDHLVEKAELLSRRSGDLTALEIERIRQVAKRFEKVADDILRVTSMH